MGIKQDQRNAYNDALKVVQKTNEELIALYKAALKDANQKLADFKLKIDKGYLSPGEARADKRLKKLVDEINDNIQKLYFVQGDIMTSGWTENYVETYYQVSFSLEKEINLVTLPDQGASYDYGLNYRKVNPAFVKSELNTIVAGMTFKDRQGIDKAILQGRVRSVIDSAIVEGLTPKQVAEQLKGIDDAFAKSANKALTTSRTELLRAYSIAAEESALIAQDRGVDVEKIWDATLDGRTRPAHGRADGQKADENGFFFVGGEKLVAPRMGRRPENNINCRCKAVYLPEGVKPNTRGFRTADGDWKQTYGDMTYEEWAKTLEGSATIEQSKIERREAAKRAAKKRAKENK